MMLAPTAENPKARLAKAALWGGLFTLAAIYLFATRPEPLADNAIAERSVSTEKAFHIVAAENDAVRALWTSDIVGAGVIAGLKFSEKWREPDVAAGPLPALFLRESATALQKTRVSACFSAPITRSQGGTLALLIRRCADGRSAELCVAGLCR